LGVSLPAEAFSGVGWRSRIPLASVRVLKLGVLLQILWLRSRESGSTIEKEGREVDASRLRRYPRLLFANAANVEDLAVRVGIDGPVEEGRAESLSEDVNLEDDDVT
jgi:hypothetical protein